ARKIHVYTRGPPISVTQHSSQIRPTSRAEKRIARLATLNGGCALAGDRKPKVESASRSRSAASHAQPAARSRKSCRVLAAGGVGAALFLGASVRGDVLDGQLFVQSGLFHRSASRGGLGAQGAGAAAAGRFGGGAQRGGAGAALQS